MGLGLGNPLWWVVDDGVLRGEPFPFDVEISQDICTITEMTTVFTVDAEFTQSSTNCAETTGTFDEDPEFGVDIDKPTDR